MRVCVLFFLLLSDNRVLQRSVVRCIQFGQLAARKSNADIHSFTSPQKSSASQMKENKLEDKDVKPAIVRIIFEYIYVEFPLKKRTFRFAAATRSEMGEIGLRTYQGPITDDAAGSPLLEEYDTAATFTELCQKLNNTFSLKHNFRI